MQHSRGTSGDDANANRVALSLPSSPQVPFAHDALPSISPGVVYSTAHAVWSPHELQLLHRGLLDFPIDKYDNVTRYIKIAATIPGKCVRDVAFKVRALTVAVPTADDRQFTAKRMRGESLVKPEPKLTMMQESQLEELLRDNALVINSMRTNLLNGKCQENLVLMVQFRDMCQTLASAIRGLCRTIPALPVKPDTSLISTPNQNSPADPSPRPNSNPSEPQNPI